MERLVRLGDGLLEGGVVLAVAGQSLDHILDLHLEHDVHTALEVETQVELLLLALLVGEGLESHVEHGSVLHRIQIVLLGLGLVVEVERGGILGRLLLYATCLERKRELVNARERQKDRDEFNKTFTLHLVEKNLLLFVVIIVITHNSTQR